MSKWTTGLTAMAVGAILGVGRSAIAQDPCDALTFSNTGFGFGVDV